MLQLALTSGGEDECPDARHFDRLYARFEAYVKCAARGLDECRVRRGFIFLPANFTGACAANLGRAVMDAPFDRPKELRVTQIRVRQT